MAAWLASRPTLSTSATLVVLVVGTVLVGALAYLLTRGEAYPTQPAPWVESIIVAMVAHVLWKVFRSSHEILALAVPVFVGGRSTDRRPSPRGPPRR